MEEVESSRLVQSCIPAGVWESMGVVVNFDLGERFPRPRSQQRGSLRPRARRVAVLGVGAGGGRPPLRWSGVSPPENFSGILMPNPRLGAIWARK